MLLALLMCAPTGMRAQLAVTTATLGGSVTDPSGAVVPQAVVNLTSTLNGVHRTYTTDAIGRYIFPQLAPSTYTLLVVAKGFEAYQQTGITLDPGQTATQNVALLIGSMTQQIVVNAQASQLNTDNSNVSADLDAKQIVELPLNNRNVYGLITLNSSVNNTSEGQMLLGGGSNSTDNADQDISFLNFAGGFFGTSAFMLDGSWDTDPEWGAVIYVPSVDAVQELKIQSNSFTAQYGWSTGNVVNVVTKSGTNSFHGAAYEFYRNQNLDCQPVVCSSDDTPMAKLSRNQFGGIRRWPARHPRTLSAAREDLPLRSVRALQVTTPSLGTYTVPDANFLNGNFSELLGAQYRPGFDGLGRPIYPGQIYDPRSGPTRSRSASTPGAVDNDGQCKPTCYIRDPIPGNILSNLAGYTPDPVGAKLLSYYPKATLPGSGAITSLYRIRRLPISDEYLIRVDHNISNSARAYFRYSYKKETKTGSRSELGSRIRRVPATSALTTAGVCGQGCRKVFSPTFTMNIAAGRPALA